MGKLKGVKEWLEIHLNGDCEVNPPTRDCLISLAQAIEYELAQPNQSKGGK